MIAVLDPRHRTATVVDLLAALERSPGDYEIRMVLADALADAGHEGSDGMRWLAEKGRESHRSPAVKVGLGYSFDWWRPDEWRNKRFSAATIPLSMFDHLAESDGDEFVEFMSSTHASLAVCEAFAATPERRSEWWEWVPPGKGE